MVEQLDQGQTGYAYAVFEQVYVAVLVDGELFVDGLEERHRVSVVVPDENVAQSCHTVWTRISISNRHTFDTDMNSITCACLGCRKSSSSEVWHSTSRGGDTRIVEQDRQSSFHRCPSRRACNALFRFERGLYATELFECDPGEILHGTPSVTSYASNSVFTAGSNGRTLQPRCRAWHRNTRRW